MVPPEETIGSRIRRARVAAGYRTIRAFSEGLKRHGGTTHEITVGAWEKGKHTPGREHLELIAKSTGVSVDWLLRGDESASPPLPSVLAEFFAREAPTASPEARRWMLGVLELLPANRRADQRFLKLAWLAYEGLPELTPNDGVKAATFTQAQLDKP